MTPVATALAPRDIAERVLSTFVQVYLAVVLASATGRVSWVDAFFVALFAAAVSALTSVLLVYGVLKRFDNAYADLAYRVVVTFGQTLLGYLVAAGAISALAFDWTSAVKLSLIAAGTALLKGLIGLRATETVGSSVFVVADAKAPAG